jgi:hypothetical protein
VTVAGPAPARPLAASDPTRRRARERRGVDRDGSVGRRENGFGASLGRWLWPVSAVLGLVAPACADDAGPRLFAVTPSSARRNAMVTITGTRLCGAAGDCATAGGEIALGRDPPMVRAIVTDYSDSVAQIIIPTVTPVGPTAVIATVNEHASNALDFEVLP